MAPSANTQRNLVQSPLPLATSKDLRLWSAPETILAVTNLRDEETLLLHAVQQARQSGARILLLHVAHTLSSSPARGRDSRALEGQLTIKEARSELDRMARQLRWVGIRCEAVFLKDPREEEIQQLAKSRGVDRVLVSLQAAEENETRTAVTLFPACGVPVCVIGKSVLPFSEKQRPTRRITLAISLHSNCDIPLKFASRLAQEHHAHLTILHVVSGSGGNVARIDQTPAAVASRLRAETLREAELLCPLEIVVRAGDPADELLKYVASTNQDFLILGSPIAPGESESGGAGIANRIVNEAMCPVFLLSQVASFSAQDCEAPAPSPKPPQGVYI